MLSCADTRPQLLPHRFLRYVLNRGHFLERGRISVSALQKAAGFDRTEKTMAHPPGELPTSFRIFLCTPLHLVLFDFDLSGNAFARANLLLEDHVIGLLASKANNFRSMEYTNRQDLVDESLHHSDIFHQQSRESGAATTSAFFMFHRLSVSSSRKSERNVEVGMHEKGDIVDV